MHKKHTSSLLADEKTSSNSHSFYVPYETFPEIDEVFKTFQQKNFLELSLRKRFRIVNQTLYQLIQDAPEPAYLLSAVLDFFDRINQEKILKEPFNFTTFEFWLNHFSNLNDQENAAIRSKIVGKHIPRQDYQAYFPIGMNRHYNGTHFVAAHLSPDVDTMIASFWGWVDAFGTRIGTGLHLWSLPGGPPDSPFSKIFQNLLGPALFPLSARTAQTLRLTAMDLLSQKHFFKQLGHILTSTIDHEINDQAVILVNELGHYLGDWRNSDVELVRQITILFKSCLRWFENNLHTQLISLFAKKNLSIQDLPDFQRSVFDVKIKDCEPAKEFSLKQTEDLDNFFVKILGMEKGLGSTFRDLIQALERLSVVEMSNFQKEIEDLATSDIFDSKGFLKEDRPQIFYHLEHLINRLDESIHHVRNYVERLDVVVGIKSVVLELPLVYVTLRSDIDEMRLKMQHYDFLTVVIEEDDGSLFPVGVIREKDLRRTGLGTVSFRDFCNQEEVKMDSYLEVISVIDHHKSALKTISVPSVITGDVQSCNVLLAEQAFLINDKYSLGGLNIEQIEEQIKHLVSHMQTPSDTRILQRLLQRRLAAQTRDQFYIHSSREFQEYLCFLYAILDDTDLLTKVSVRDVECVAQLLNRLKSLVLRKEVEIIHFDDIPRDHKFAKLAAQRILQQQDMYSLYREVYQLREIEVESNLNFCRQGQSSNIFLDAKEQNGCARVGQTKIFVSNFPYFLQHAQDIQAIWLNKSQEVNQDHPEIDLHIHMISTIASADEVYKNQIGPYHHQDQLWFWIPFTSTAEDHLKSFLLNFQSVIKEIESNLVIEYAGLQTSHYEQLFSRYFPTATQKFSHSSILEESFVILHFQAGLLNSRKAMVSPFLPRLIS